MLTCTACWSVWYLPCREKCPSCFEAADSMEKLTGIEVSVSENNNIYTMKYLTSGMGRSCKGEAKSTCSHASSLSGLAERKRKLQNLDLILLLPVPNNIHRTFQQYFSLSVCVMD